MLKHVERPDPVRIRPGAELELCHVEEFVEVSDDDRRRGWWVGVLGGVRLWISPGILKWVVLGRGWIEVS